MARIATSSNNGNDLYQGSDGDDMLTGNNASDDQLGRLDDASLSGGIDKRLLLPELGDDLLDGGRDDSGAGTLIAIVHVRDQWMLSNDDLLAF